MDINEIRLQNIEKLISTQCGGVRSSFARKIKRTPVSIGRWWTNSKHRRNVGDDTAREIETTFNLPRGWIDNVHLEIEMQQSTAEQRFEQKIQRGEAYRIPLTHEATLDQRLTVTFLDKVKGTVMLLSTDENAYALQLIGHNPTAWFSHHWGIIIEPGTELTPNESALFRLDSGETILRLVTHISDDMYVVLNPLTGNQENLPRSRVKSAEYAYIGIPPSKIKLEKPDD